MRWVGEDLASSADESADHLLERYCRRSSHDRSGQQPPEGASTTTTTDGDGTTAGADRGHSAPRFDTSPFDLFYYKNTEASRHVVNCNRHVGTAAIRLPETPALLPDTQLNAALLADPGFMTVVPCAATPGLELLDAATMEWISVRRALVLLINDFTTHLTSSHLTSVPQPCRSNVRGVRTRTWPCSAAKAYRQSLKGSTLVRAPTSRPSCTQPSHSHSPRWCVCGCGGACHPGIVHCVGKSRRPRLSLVYELRPALHD
jgi:hypothetical protein